MSDPAAAQYANAPVPEDATVPGWRVALIITSFSVALPAFLYGAQAGLALGLEKAVLSAFIGGLVLCAGGALTAVISVRTRLTTYLLVQKSFGRSGAMLVNVVMAVVQLGWFGVNVSFFAEAMLALTNQLYGAHVHFATFLIAGSILMTVSTIYGFRMLERLALVTVPLFGLALAAVCFAAVHRHGVVLVPRIAAPVPMTFGVALSAQIGGNMVAVATMPDLTRFIRDSRGAISAMALSYPLAAPLMMLISALTALATGQTDIMSLIVGFGFGAPALILLVLSSWTLNALNLYSASLSLSATFPRISPTAFTVGGGIVGAAFGLAGIINAFVPFLLALGVVIPPIAAIYVIDAFDLLGNGRVARAPVPATGINWVAIATWLGSMAIVIPVNLYWGSFTGVSTLDATIVAAIVYLSVKWFLGRSARLAC
jgi:cytosine permease